MGGGGLQVVMMTDRALTCGRASTCCCLFNAARRCSSCCCTWQRRRRRRRRSLHLTDTWATSTSARRNVKRRGPKTDPWGTLQVMYRYRNIIINFKWENSISKVEWMFSRILIWIGPCPYVLSNSLVQSGNTQICFNWRNSVDIFRK